MNLATWSIRQPIPVVVAFLLATLAGLYGFYRLPVQDMPDIAMPAVTISARLGSVAAAQLETEVTRKIEDSIANVQGVRDIASVVSIGSSITTVQFEIGTDLGDAVDEVRDAIARVRSDLPADLQEPVVEKITTAGPIQAYSIRRAWTRKRCPGLSTLSSHERCWAFPASAEFVASAARNGRSGSIWIRPSSRRSTPRPQTYREPFVASSRMPLAASHAWVR
jgi:Cu/Ag efflux pump CusA